jgi:hypothetical protein
MDLVEQLWMIRSRFSEARVMAFVGRPGVETTLYRTGLQVAGCLCPLWTLSHLGRVFQASWIGANLMIPDTLPVWLEAIVAVTILLLATGALLAAAIRQALRNVPEPRPAISRSHMGRSSLGWLYWSRRRPGPRPPAAETPVNGRGISKPSSGT